MALNDHLREHAQRDATSAADLRHMGEAIGRIETSVSSMGARVDTMAGVLTDVRLTLAATAPLVDATVAAVATEARTTRGVLVWALERFLVPLLIALGAAGAAVYLARTDPPRAADPPAQTAPDKAAPVSALTVGGDHATDH